MIKQNRIIIIGGNAAGPAAAAHAKRINPSSDVILFEATEFISTGTCEIPYILGKVIDDYKKIIFFDEETFYQKKGVKVFTKHFVDEIDRKNKILKIKDLKSGEFKTFNYDKLILATGSKAKKIASFSDEYKNVFNLKNINDLLSVQNFINQNNIKKCVIVGSGFLGLETAEAFYNLGIEVTLIDKNKFPLSSSDNEIQQLVNKILNKYNINFYGNVNELNHNVSENHIKSFNIDGRKIESDLIISAVGFEPNNILALKSGLEIGKYEGIKVDNRMRTNDNNIYACGDSVELINLITGKSDYLPLATLARNYSYIAAENATGGNAIAKPFLKNISLKIFDKYFAQVGLSEKEVEQNKYNYYSVIESAKNLVSVMPESEDVFGKLIINKLNGELLGASFLGGKEVSGYADIISTLIQTKQKAKTLSSINFNYTPPLSPFTNLLSLLGRKIK